MGNINLPVRLNSIYEGEIFLLTEAYELTDLIMITYKNTGNFEYSGLWREITPSKYAVCRCTGVALKGKKAYCPVTKNKISKLRISKEYILSVLDHLKRNY